eukprot:3911813-Pyramimonas_sp.AAC.1
MKAQKFLDMFIPAWSEFRIEDKLLYLGMRVGPGASEDDSWELPASKCRSRCAAVGRGPTPASFSAILHSTRCTSVLSYVMQFLPIPKSLKQIELGCLSQ